MRLKKGFTLAEILIVLIVIGAIATMTIPSLMKGVTESQWKTAYKKAYNAIVNMCAMERISGSMPTASDSAKVRITKVYKSMLSSLSVREFAKPASKTALLAENTYTNSQLYAGLKITGYMSDSVTETIYGGSSSSSSTTDEITDTISDHTPWAVTEDNIAYSVISGDDTSSCGTKADINAQNTVANINKKACAIVIVDVNGLASGPNSLETQIKTILDANKNMSSLTGDRYYIYVGTDGATSGSKKYTVSGRIVGDLK